MAKYSAQLVAKSSENKNVTTTLSNVNPETAPVKIKQFAQTLNALTTNTYNETNYIVTTNLDTETPPVDTRQTPTLALSSVPTLTQVKANTMSWTGVNYTGDGYIYARVNSGCQCVAFSVFENSQIKMTKPNGTTVGDELVTGGTFIVGATGTDNFKPIEVEYTLE